MIITLNKEVAQKKGMTIDEVLLMVIIQNNIKLEVAEKALIHKGYITAALNLFYQPEGFRITNRGAEVLNSVIIDSDKKQEPEDRLLKLATSLKAVFPKGKKDGTNYYWADGVALIERRLKLFFKKYGESLNSTFENEYSSMTKEEFDNFIDTKIINATNKYVEGFNGCYQYMRLLKYFIFKEKIGANREIEGDSELISYIENAGQEEDLKNDWTSTLK